MALRASRVTAAGQRSQPYRGIFATWAGSPVRPGTKCGLHDNAVYYTQRGSFPFDACTPLSCLPASVARSPRSCVLLLAGQRILPPPRRCAASAVVWKAFSRGRDDGSSPDGRVATQHSHTGSAGVASTAYTHCRLLRARSLPSRGPPSPVCVSRRWFFSPVCAALQTCPRGKEVCSSSTLLIKVRHVLLVDLFAWHSLTGSAPFDSVGRRRRYCTACACICVNASAASPC